MPGAKTTVIRMSDPFATQDAPFGTPCGRVVWIYWSITGRLRLTSITTPPNSARAAAISPTDPDVPTIPPVDACDPELLPEWVPEPDPLPVLEPVPDPVP